VVLVTATAGEHGLAHPDAIGADGLAHHRLQELDRSAAALGCARVVVLGYGDSGMAGQPSSTRDSASRSVRVEVRIGL
jgi:LmbE family N-acetylglucosaminyl deacetylase